MSYGITVVRFNPATSAIVETLYNVPANGDVAIQVSDRPGAGYWIYAVGVTSGTDGNYVLNYCYNTVLVSNR